jgi:cytosine deaminase
MVTERAAVVLGLGERYGIEVGRPANLMLLPAIDSFDAVRRQVRPTHVIAHGKLVAVTPPHTTTLTWPGYPPASVDFVRSSDVAQASWRHVGEQGE